MHLDNEDPFKGDTLKLFFVLYRIHEEWILDTPIKATMCQL